MRSAMDSFVKALSNPSGISESFEPSAPDAPAPVRRAHHSIRPDSAPIDTAPGFRGHRPFSKAAPSKPEAALASSKILRSTAPPARARPDADRAAPGAQLSV